MITYLFVLSVIAYFSFLFGNANALVDLPPFDVVIIGTNKILHFPVGEFEDTSLVRQLMSVLDTSFKRSEDFDRITTLNEERIRFAKSVGNQFKNPIIYKLFNSLGNQVTGDLTIKSVLKYGSTLYYNPLVVYSLRLPSKGVINSLKALVLNPS